MSRLCATAFRKCSREPSQRSRCFTTAGDRAANQPLSEIGGECVFTGELERALHAGEIDFAVHSLKDLPIGASGGLVPCPSALVLLLSAVEDLDAATVASILKIPEGTVRSRLHLARRQLMKALW